MGEEQILRAGLGEYIATLRPGRRNRRQRLSQDRCTIYNGAPATTGQPDRRGVASPSRSGGRDSRDKPDRSGPGPSACSTRTSIAMPFSACIMISAPLSDACWHRPQDFPVGRIENAGVRHKEFEAEMPSPTRPSISFSVCSLTSDMIMWKP